MLDIKTQVSPTRTMTQRKVSTTIIGIFLISVLLALFARALIGPVLQNTFNTTDFSSTPVSGGYADITLKESVWGTLINFERTVGCETTTSTSIVVQQQMNTQGIWSEKWGVNACGENQAFQIRFLPDLNGGTSYVISK